MMDLGLHHVGKIKYYASRKLFTVEDGEDVYVYEHPKGVSKKDIRIALHVGFIDDERDNLDGEYKVTGRYPNYRIEEVT